jgi:hypothetical protein
MYTFSSLKNILFRAVQLITTLPLIESQLCLRGHIGHVNIASTVLPAMFFVQSERLGLL